MINIIAWIVLGAIAGYIAGMLVKGDERWGVIGHIVLGIVGAFVGGWIFSAAGWGTPFAGIAGTIFVAFIGAVVLLVIIHLVRGGTRRRNA